MNQTTDYDQSFQRMVAGYSEIYVKPGLKLKNHTDRHQQNSNNTYDFNAYNNQNKKHHNIENTPTTLSYHKCQKFLEYQKCRDWARKHRKDSSYYDRMLDINSSSESKRRKRISGTGVGSHHNQFSQDYHNPYQKKQSERKQYMSQIGQRMSEIVKQHQQ